MLHDKLSCFFFLYRMFFFLDVFPPADSITFLRLSQVLKGNYQSLPKQAISCSLNKAIPPNSAWSEEAKTAFSDLIIEKDAVIKVIEKSSDNYVVDLLDVNGKHLASDMLLSKGFAADSVQQVSMQGRICELLLESCMSKNI